MGDVLTRETAGEHVDGGKPLVHLAHVGHHTETRPPVVENLNAVAILLARPHGAEAGAFKAEVETAAA